MRLLHIITFIFIATFCSAASFCEKPYYHKVPARKGDSIERFLSRYMLFSKDCNVREFYILNKLEEGSSKLMAETEYFLPVLIYTYNGKSIRSTVGLESWEQAVRIKRYNEELKEKKLRQQTIVNSNILWVPFHELYCTDDNVKNKPDTPEPGKDLAKEPAKSDDKSNDKSDDKSNDEPNSDKLLSKAHRTYPIFGKKHAHIPLKNNKLQGKVFYIVSGHGGPDPGAIGKRSVQQLCEDEYAYDISLRIVRNLLEHGAIAYMITRDPDDGLRDGQYLECDTDEYCWGNKVIPLSQKKRLFQRSDAINELYEKHLKQGITDQTTITLHIDSRSRNKRTDVFFYHFPGSKEGKQLAKSMQKALAAKYKKHRKGGLYSGTVTPRDLHMLREVKPTTVYIELGNIRNPTDQTRFVLRNNRQALANWLFEGLL